MSNPRHDRKDNQHSGQSKKELGQSAQLTDGRPTRQTSQRSCGSSTGGQAEGGMAWLSLNKSAYTHDRIFLLKSVLIVFCFVEISSVSLKQAPLFQRNFTCFTETNTVVFHPIPPLGGYIGCETLLLLYVV